MYTPLIIILPNHTIKELQKIFKKFLCGTADPKWKNDKLCNIYKQGDLKNIGVPKKIGSL